MISKIKISRKFICISIDIKGEGKGHYLEFSHEKIKINKAIALTLNKRFSIQGIPYLSSFCLFEKINYKYMRDVDTYAFWLYCTIGNYCQSVSFYNFFNLFLDRNI